MNNKKLIKFILIFVYEYKGLFIKILLLSNIIWIKNIFIIKRLTKLFSSYDKIDNISIIRNSVLTFFLIIFSVDIGMRLIYYVQDQITRESVHFFCKKFYYRILDTRSKNITEQPQNSIYRNIRTFSLRARAFLIYIIDIVPNVLLLISCIIRVCLFDFKLGVIFFVTYFGIIYKIFNNLNSIQTKRKDVENKLKDIVDLNKDLNDNITTISSFNQLYNEKNNLKTIFNQLKIASTDYSFEFNKNKGIFFLYHIGIIIFFAYNIIRKGLTTDKYAIEIFLYLFYFTIHNSSNIIDCILNINLNISVLNFYYNEISNKFPKTEERYEINKIKKRKIKQGIVIRNMSDNIFKNLNLNIDDHKITILIGNIGSGKSSLLKAIFAIKQIKKGDILYRDKSVFDLEWKNNIHYLEQNPTLFDRSIEENIFYGNLNDTQKDKYNLLIKKFNLESYSNYTNTSGKELSNGQKQILSLLRILLIPKPIIILDEPTSSIDPITKEIIYKIILYLKEKKHTLIIATHDSKLVDLGDNVVKLFNGSIIKN